MGPIWGPHETFRSQMDPMLAPWTLLSGYTYLISLSASIRAEFVSHINTSSWYPTISFASIGEIKLRRLITNGLSCTLRHHIINSNSNNNDWKYTHRLKLLDVYWSLHYYSIYRKIYTKVWGSLFSCSYIVNSSWIYHRTSNISRTLVCNKMVDPADVVGTSPVGAASTASSFSTWHLASRDSAKTAARQYENLLKVGIWCLISETWRYM